VKAVLDTNVVVSAFLSPAGVCRRVIDQAFERRFEPCVDARIIREYKGVLGRPELRILPEEAAGFLDFVASASERVAVTPLSLVLPDPDDLPFLEVARESDAILVTGNLRHFPQDRRAGVSVLSPREFLELLGRSE